MAESKVKRENSHVLQGWMIRDLNLKGNELIIYAIIFSFSQKEDQKFFGGLQYLADWTNSTKQGALKCLKSLCEKGYITKNDVTINGVKFCEYCATELNTVLNKVERGIEQSLTVGIKQSLPNNTDINNTLDNTKKEKKERKETGFDEIIANFTQDPKTVDLLKEWLKVRKAKRAAFTDRAIKMNLDKLEQMAKQSGLTVNDYLGEVICRGWAAFYPINTYSGTGGQNAKSESGGKWSIGYKKDVGDLPF